MQHFFVMHTVTSFEELLARELGKSQQEQESANAPSGARRKAVEKKPFLKKGDRGWWMQRPDVKAKLPKHVLTSRDIDGAESSSSRATTAAASASQRSSNQQSVAARKSSRLSLERQQSQASDATERRRRVELPKLNVTPSNPPPLSPSTRRRQQPPERHPPSPPPTAVRQSYSSGYDNRVTIKTQPAAARLSDSMRTTTSVDTLGMSRVRQSYEAQLEREADELADFEAIERELAAEKDAYLMEKQQFRRESDSFEAKPAPPWHFSSGSQAQSEQEHLLPQETIYQNSAPRGNLDLNGLSSLLFGDDPSFSSDRRRTSDHFAAPQPHHYADDELSAISLNDSESWDNHLSEQLPHGYPSRGSLSPIPKRDSASNLLDSAPSGFAHGYGSFESNTAYPADQQTSRRRASDVLSEDLYGFNDDARSQISESKPPVRGEPPVSALMQQFFGGNQSSSSDKADEDEQYETSHDSDYYQDEADAYQQSKPRRYEDDEPASARSISRSRVQAKPKNSSSSTGRIATSNQTASGSRVDARPSMPARQSSSRANASKVVSAPSAKVRSGPILPVVIEEKLFELEEEVKFYKAETLQLQKKKDFYDQAVKKLAKEREEFARFQSEQGVLIEKEWEKERLKMKREEKLMERQIKLKLSAAASHHDRKERGEIDALKAQIVKMQLDEKARANKWKAMNDNLRQRVGVRSTHLRDQPVFVSLANMRPGVFVCFCSCNRSWKTRTAS